MLVFIQKSKSGSLSLSVYKAAPFVWQQMILLMYINKSLPSRASLVLSLQPIFFSSLSLGLVLSGSSPRGHCVTAGRLFPPSAKEGTRLAGSYRKEIKSTALSLSFMAKAKEQCRKSA